MNFPLVTWQVTAPGFDVNGTPVGPFNNVWGFGLSGTTGSAQTDSLAGVFADALVSGGGLTAALAYYQFVDNTTPSLTPLRWRIEALSGGPCTVTFASLDDAAVYGFDTLTVTFSAAPSASTVYNPAGMWAPSGVSGDVTRTTKQRAASSSSDMSGLSTDIVNWGQVADIEVRSTLFPAANAFRWYATQQIYATKAGRNVADPNNILEVMLAAAATGVTFRIYEGAATTPGTTVSTYQIAKMPGISEKSAAGDFITADDEPRLWTLAGMFFRGNT
jgi:hypothetical protein